MRMINDDIANLNLTNCRPMSLCKRSFVQPDTILFPAFYEKFFDLFWVLTISSCYNLAFALFLFLNLTLYCYSYQHKFVVDAPVENQRIFLLDVISARFDAFIHTALIRHCFPGHVSTARSSKCFTFTAASSPK